MQVLLQFGDRYLAKVEHTGCQGGIGMTQEECVAKMLPGTGSTAGNDRDGQHIGQTGKCLVGIALLHPVMVHTGKEYFAGTTLLGFVCPFKEVVVGTLTAALQIAIPRRFTIYGFTINNFV